MALQITSTINSDSGQTSAAYVRIRAITFDGDMETVLVRVSVYISQAASVNKFDTIISKAVKTEYTESPITAAQFENNFTVPKIYTYVKNKLIATGLTVIDV